jgi:hypothetical protein
MSPELRTVRVIRQVASEDLSYACLLLLYETEISRLDINVITD